MDFQGDNSSWEKMSYTEKNKSLFGVFTDVRQTENIEDRFEYAKIAADRAKNDPERNCGFYDRI